jgi:hypothetical protein
MMQMKVGISIAELKLSAISATTATPRQSIPLAAMISARRDRMTTGIVPSRRCSPPRRQGETIIDDHAGNLRQSEDVGITAEGCRPENIPGVGENQKRLDDLSRVHDR